MNPPRTFWRYIRGLTLVEFLVVLAVLAVLMVLLLPLLGQALAKANASKCISNLKQISAASALYSTDNSGSWPPGQTGGAIFANALIPYLGAIPSREDSNFRSSPLICPATNNAEVPNSTFWYHNIYTPSTYTEEGTGRKIRYGLAYAQNVYALSGTNHTHYIKNRIGVEQASKMMLYMDYTGQHIISVGGLPDKREDLEKRHLKRVNTAYVDGSVRTIVWDDIPTNASTFPVLFWQGKGGGNN